MNKNSSAPSTSIEEQGSIQFGTKTIEYTVRRSRRRKKTIEITLDHRARVLVAAPMRTPRERIREVVLKRASWIVQRAAGKQQAPPREFVGGESLPYLGREFELVVENVDLRRCTIAFEGSRFRVAVPVGLNGEQRHQAIAATLLRWYRVSAAEHLPQEVERWAKVMRLVSGRVLIRDQRCRWGSCAADGTLRFNWRIITASPALIDYLVVHELLHLRVRNHSPAFWSELATFIPDYKLRRSQLKSIDLQLTI